MKLIENKKIQEKLGVNYGLQSGIVEETRRMEREN